MKKERKILVCKPVVLKKNCWIGAGDNILPGVTVGENAIVGAGSVVTKNVEPNTIVAGNPAKVIQPLFYVDKGDTIKVVSVHAKSCRGAMTRHIIQNHLSHPANLLGFELNGFKYDQNYGDELHPHFIKR